MRDPIEDLKKADSGLRSTPGKLRHHLLIAIAPHAISEYLVRWTHQLAGSLNCSWIAVHVQTSSKLAQSDQLLLMQSLSLARELGAEVITTSDESVVHGLLRTAAGRNITQIIVGKPESRPVWQLFRRDAVVRQLIQGSGDIGVHVVRVPNESKRIPIGPLMRRFPGMEYAVAVLAVAGVTGLGLVVEPFLGYRSISWIFLSAVMALAFFVGRGPILIAATLSALAWDFFFEMPRFSLFITNRDDQQLFILYFAVALVLGQLTSRIRRQEEAEREREERSKSLFLLSRDLAVAADRDDLLRKAVQHMERAFGAQLAVLVPDARGSLTRHPASNLALSEDERRAALRAFEQGRETQGEFEDLRQGTVLFVALSAYGEAEGVAALRFNRFPIALQERNLIDEEAQQIAMALHRHRMREISEKSNLLAESERLSKTLLDAMSHEIRTPLAAIQAAASNIVQLSQTSGPASQSSMVAEIQEATDRLDRLVEKILHITRLDSGFVKSKLEWQDIRELFQMAEDQTRQELRRHNLALEIAPDLPHVRMDYELMLHALTNLLSNAARHTPENTDVRLSAYSEGESLVLSVTDSGPGIPPQSLPNLFDKFYRAPQSKPGGVGLGLSIVKGFVEAQGGKVSAANHPDGGAVFSIRMPIEKDTSRVVPVDLAAEKCAC
jgi:two-component system sensor histidine kinase KdpD